MRSSITVEVMTKRRTFAIALTAVLVIGSGATLWAFVANDAGQSSAAGPPVAPPTASAPLPSSTADAVVTEQSAGAYVDYSTDVIAETAGDKVLFFHAPWCPNCRELESDIETSGVPAGLTIIKVDYDSEVALRQKYGVTLQTTVVYVDDDGDKLSSAVLYDDPSLEALVAAAP
jgi:thiol-disulfide isomerase/thioredoxin